MSQDSKVTFRIGLLGPSRVGKTSLVTALLAESHNLLAGSGVTMYTVGLKTEDKVADNRKQLEGDILAGEFRPGSLKSTVEPFTFNLKLDPGVESSEINIELLDFPGGWLDAQKRPEQASNDWANSRKFITESTILLVPVDAALLMEAVESEHKRALPHLLTTVEVEQVARDWAIERNRLPAEPALIAFCPVKCESYFIDNGGRRNKSGQLLKLFTEVYAGTIEAVRAQPHKASLIYVPVDTIGCLEMVDADWPIDPETGKRTFSAAYRIRRPARISRVGVDDVMKALCKQLMAGRRLMSAELGEGLELQAQQAHRYAERSEGFFRDILLW